jgi:hypothetical protein
VAGFEPATGREFTPLVVNNDAFVYQMGSLPTDTQLIPKDNVIGDARIPGYDLAPSKFVMGEKICSVYNMIKRFCSCEIYQVANSVYFTHAPFEIGAMGRGQAVTAFSISPLTADPLSLFTSFYAYSRGSTQFRAIYTGGAAEQINTSFLNIKVNNSVLSQTATSEVHRTPKIFQTKATDLGMNFAAPPYMELHARLNRLNPADLTNYTTYAPPNDEYSNDYNVSMEATTASNSYSFLRAAGDDYQLGFFLGIPPLYRASIE